MPPLQTKRKAKGTLHEEQTQRKSSLLLQEGPVAPWTVTQRLQNFKQGGNTEPHGDAAEGSSDAWHLEEPWAAWCLEEPSPRPRGAELRAQQCLFAPRWERGRCNAASPGLLLNEMLQNPTSSRGALENRSRKELLGARCQAGYEKPPPSPRYPR